MFVSQPNDYYSISSTPAAGDSITFNVCKCSYYVYHYHPYGVATGYCVAELVLILYS